MVTEYDFELAQGENCWKRVGDSHPIDLYYGKDEMYRNAIEFTGSFSINKKIRSSIAIDIRHFINKDGSKSLVFSLLDNKLLRPFCDFLNAMIEDTKDLNSSNQEAYNSVCEVYFIMQKMFRSSSELLTEAEIKGLLGELLFLRDSLIPKYGVNKSICAWSGTEKTRKDFSLDNEWFEIKTIDFGKDTVHISSIEQLDSPIEGQLIVYQVERLAEEFEGITLNSIVKELFQSFKSISDRDIFATKLMNANYSVNPKYDEYVYQLRSLDRYSVDNSFPRLSRSNIPIAISKATFDIILTEIAFLKITD